MKNRKVELIQTADLTGATFEVVVLSGYKQNSNVSNCWRVLCNTDNFHHCIIMVVEITLGPGFESANIVTSN